VPLALEHERTDPGYVAGRLFAILEKIQTDSAGGDLSETIKDRYFASASGTPARVFPGLIRVGRHHLTKMDPRLKTYFEKRIGEVVAKLQLFPSHLNLEDQGLFAIGYFHQREYLFTPKKKDVDVK
jgi:CRISPR-associated protein Csd1